MWYLNLNHLGHVASKLGLNLNHLLLKSSPRLKLGHVALRLNLDLCHPC
jgi:hypothetical protein